MGLDVHGDVIGSGRGFALVGRKRELELLLAALEVLPTVVLVEGEAGVGKSRLVQEAIAAVSARGMRVLSGYCHPLREPLPFGPVLQALRDTAAWLPDPATMNPQCGALAPLLPELAGHLPPVPEKAPTPRAARFQLVGAVRALLDAVGPVVLVVEDLHWIDEATRELLLLLARDPPRALGLVLTYRREDLPAHTPLLGSPYRRPVGTSGAEIHLDALTEHDVRDLASAVLGPRATPALARMLYRRSAGLPLIAEEDLLTLGDRHPQNLPYPDRDQRHSGTDDVTAVTRAEVPRDAHTLELPHHPRHGRRRTRRTGQRGR